MNKKVLFVHDGPMYQDEKREFWGISLNDKIVKRYSFFGKEVVFLMRLKQITGEEKNKYSKITYPFFQFIEIPNFKTIRSFFRGKKEAKKIIESAVLNCDVVIVRLPSSAGVIAFNCALKHKKPVLVEFVACVFDSLWNYNWKGKLLAHYKFFKYKMLLRNSKHTIYVTEKFLQSRYPSKGKAIGCSDVELADGNERIINKRLEKIESQQGPLVLGTVAALDVPYKGQADVIKAIGALKKRGIIFKYQLVGRGDPSKIQKEIQKHGVEDLVEIIGPIKHDEVFNFLKKIDIYIQPSKQEGLPRGLIEAMSTGCPSVGSTTGGIPELLTEEAVLKKNSSKQILKKLKSIDRPFLTRMATRNFLEAQKYTSDVLENRRLAFYKEFKEDYRL